MPFLYSYMLFAPFLSAVSSSVGIVLDRFVLSKRGVDAGAFLLIVFFFIAFETLLLFPFLGEFYPSFFRINAYSLFFMCVLLACIHNILLFYAQKKETVEKLEPFLMTASLMSIFIASLVFPEERKISVLIAAVIASLALISVSIRRHHFRPSKYCLMVFLSSIFIALELNMSKEVLHTMSPVALYCLRAVILSFIFFPFYIKKAFKVQFKNFPLLFFIAFLGVVQFVGIYYGVSAVGVVMTSLILTLQPTLVFLFSHFFLKEKVHKKNLYASLIVVVCILFATIF